MCGECERQIRRREGICPKCGRYSARGRVHEACRKPWGMDGLIAPLSSGRVIQWGMKKVKHKSAWEFVSAIFMVWRKRLDGGEAREEGWLVVPVPIWHKKERERGFNQARMLAELVADWKGWELQEALRRVRKTKPQYGLRKEERRKNMLGAFRLKARVVGRKVILVDDVWTTGATMRECAKSLKRGRAKVVWGVVLAR